MAKEKSGKFKKFLGILVFVLIVAACAHYAVKYFMASLVYEWTDDAFLEAHVTAVSPRIAGHIRTVYVDDNQLVKKGDLLVEIDDADYQVKTQQALAAFEAAKAQNEQVTAQITAAKAEARRSQSDLKRYQELVANNSVSKQQYDNAVAAADSAAAQVEAVTKQASVAVARIAEANSTLAQSKLELSYTKIYAPQDGRVTKKAVEPGEYIYVGQPLLAIVPQDVYVIANFKETQLKRIKVGQFVDIKVDAYKDLHIKGSVNSIQSGTGARFSLLPPENATGNYVKVVQRVPVKITIDSEPNDNFVLAPGMSVIPKVKVK